MRLNKEWTQLITHSETCYDWLYSQNTVIQPVCTKLSVCVVAVRVCNSAGKCECCTIRETDNNTECKIITGQIICSSLALLCMNGIYFVTFCFGNGSHLCTVQNKTATELNWTKTEFYWTKKSKHGFEHIHPSIIVCFMPLSVSICLPSPSSADTSHHCGPRAANRWQWKPWTLHLTNPVAHLTLTESTSPTESHTHWWAPTHEEE